MDIETVKSVVSEFGLSVGISVLAILLTYRYFSRKMEQEMSGKKIVSQDFPLEFDIQRHSILSALEIFYSTTVHTCFCFTNPVKQLLWTDFLVMYYQAMYDFLKEGLEKNYHELPSSKFKSTVTSWFLDLPAYCEKRVSEEMASHFENPAILPIILQQFRLLSRHDYEVFFRMLTELFETPALVNNKQKLAAILYVWKAFNLLMMTTIGTVLKSLNGTLDHVVYKGVRNTGKVENVERES